MMEDRISSLPDTVLCHVLSFLPTKVAVATSLLCKRWNHLWRSVPVLDFDDDNYHTNNETYFRFGRSVYAFILSRDMDQPLQRFCLSSSYLCDPVNVKAWLVAATQHRVEHLDFDYTLDCIFDLPTAVLTCKTLVVFKLSNVHLSSLKSCSVDLRPLKILHLNSVTFSEDRDLAELLSGSPNLEDLEVSDLYFESYVVGTKFTRLAKLVRAHIFTPEFPLEVVNNVQFLRINWMDHQCLIPEFRNLTHLKFGSYIKGLLVLDLIKHCPKLQILVIYKEKLELFAESDEGYLQSVPKCISLHLKTCILKNYEGSKREFQFVTYVMQNARYLQNMTISSNNSTKKGEKLEMLQNLSLCPRCSPTCKLSFE